MSWGRNTLARVRRVAPDGAADDAVVPAAGTGSFVPEMRPDISLELLLRRHAGEGVLVAVAQHEASDLQRLVERGGAKAAGTLREGKVELAMTADHPCQGCVQVEARSAEVFEHFIGPAGEGALDHEEDAVPAEVVGGPNDMSAPLMIGDVVEHM